VPEEQQCGNGSLFKMPLALIKVMVGGVAVGVEPK
jgi:hypothetical protein